MSDHIPQEIQALILKQLPVKSLSRFRCVCKWWRAIIDSPATRQELLALQNPRFLVQEDKRNFLVPSPLTLPLRGPIEDDETQPYLILGTLHGIVCLYDYGTNILLWNPSIHKVSTLPVPSHFKPTFHDSEMSTCSAFWIDPSNKEFKIIVMFCDTEEEEEEEPVNTGVLYSSIRRDWSVISYTEKVWIPNQQPPALMIGRVAYWAGINDSHHMHLTIMSFDFGRESFELFEMPNPNGMPALCLWQGTLSILYCDRPIDDRCRCHIDIYSRREEGSWVKVFGFNVICHSPIIKVFLPLEGMEERARALVEVFDRGDTYRERKLVLYDTVAGCIPLTSGSVNLAVVYGFVESLLFP